MQRCLTFRITALDSRTPLQLCRHLASQNTHGDSAANVGTPPAQAAPGQNAQMKIDTASRTVNTAAGALPLSPLMDPTFLEARSRFKEPKAAQSDAFKMVRWRRALRRNPYAKALATPIRTCHVTSAALPRYFLEDFNAIVHPHDGSLWWAPTSLISRQEQSPVEEGMVGSQKELERQEVEDIPAMEAGLEEQSPLPVPNPEPSRPKAARKLHKPLGRTAHVLSLQILLQEFYSSAKSRYWKASSRLVGSGPSLRLGSALRSVQWRKDMDSALLEFRRRRLVEALIKLAKQCVDKKRECLVSCQNWDEIKNHNQRGAVLWVGDKGSVVSPANTSSDLKPEEQGLAQKIAQYATMDINVGQFDKKLPVYNLPTLLGEKHLQALKDGSSLFQNGGLLLLRSWRAWSVIPLQLELWKLQGYIDHS